MILGSFDKDKMKLINCIRRKRYAIQKHFSAPLSVYLIILVLSIVLMLSQVWWPVNFTKNVLANIGYSLIASWVAAILVDYGNNKILNRKSLREFKQLTGDHEQLAHDFYNTINWMYEKKYRVDYDNITFGEMIDNILDPNFEYYNVSEQDRQECISEILCILNQFHSESKQLEKTLEEHIENPYSTGHFRSLLRNLTYEANEAIKAINNENYDWAAEVIIYNFNPIVVELYPETSLYYD